MLRHLTRGVRPAVYFLLGFCLLLCPVPTRADNDSIDPRLLLELQKVVDAREAEIRQQLNDEGERFKRTYPSNNFVKVDDDTCTVGLHVNTANDTEMVVERYQLTLHREGGTWSITNEELLDTYTGLFRGVFGDESCSRFSKFVFNREGLKITATNGNFCQDYFQGEVNRVLLTSADLSYAYTPPGGKEFSVHTLLRKEKEGDLVFTPDLVTFNCDVDTCKTFLNEYFEGQEDLGRDSVDSTLDQAYDKWEKESREDRSKNPFAGFRRPIDADNTYYWIGIRKKGDDDHWFSLTHDSDDGKEISVFLSEYGTLYTYFSEETRNSGIDPYELELRPDANGRDYEVYSLKGTVRMGHDDGTTVAGDITYGLKTKHPVRELSFGIDRVTETQEKKESKNPTMIINSVQDKDGREMTWVRTGLYRGLVILPEEVPEGSRISIRLQFVNHDSIYKVTPSFSYVSRGGWLPFVRFADMIDEFELTVAVPDRYTTLGIGKKVSDSKKDGFSVTKWVSNSPVSFPTVIYGKYEESESTVKATKMDGTKIPVHTYVDTDMMAICDIAPKALTKFANDAANSLNLYREIFKADYPYDKLDLVGDPIGGFYGQAPSSLIYLGCPTFKSKGIVAGLYEGGANLSRFLDTLVPHEVAHQWFGSLIANSNFRNYWFVESMAEYASALYSENAYDKYLDHVNSWRREILEADMRGSVQDGYNVWQGPGGFGPYRAALYSKGPYTFHIMRSTWGDEAFFAFLQNLVSDLKGKEIVTRDIQQVAEKTFGANLDWFFDQWIRGVGIPEFTFTYDVRENEVGEFVVQGQVEQRVCLKPAADRQEEIEGQYFTGLVPITIVVKGGKEYRKKLVIEGKITPFQFKLPEKPKELIFNKNGESLAYDTVVKASN